LILKGGVILVIGESIALVFTTFGEVMNTTVVASTVIVVAVAALFTIRSNVAKVWRENYDGEKEHNEALVKEIDQLKKLRLGELEQWSRSKATYEAEIQRLKVKTDLTAHEAAAERRHEEHQSLMMALASASREQTDILSSILKQLTPEA